MELLAESAVALAERVRRGEVSACELLEQHIARIEQLDGEINAVVVRDFERARQRAVELDREADRGRWAGRLHGVPMTIKESYDVAGLPTTWGYPQLRENVPAVDAVVVQRLLEAGVVLLGKTNVPTGVADFQSYNPHYGTTNNPWDLERSPGGSSGGSAAAVAAGMAALEMGSDNGSSIRNPAHYCGIFGHKPTFGIVPTRGHRAPGSTARVDLAGHGPLARSAVDLRAAMDIVAGSDHLEQPGWRLQLPEAAGLRLAGLRIGVFFDAPGFSPDAPVRARLDALVDRLVEHGARTVEIGMPTGYSAEEFFEVYMRLLWGSIAGRLPQEKIEWAREVRSNGKATTNAERLVAEAYTLSHGEWLRANEVRSRIASQVRGHFEEVDVILMPVHQTTAFFHDHNPEQWQRTRTVNGETVSYWDNLFWSAHGAALGLPATVAPVGLADDGLPVGVQILGPLFGDRLTIEFARLLESATFAGYQVPPIALNVAAR